MNANKNNVYLFSFTYKFIYYHTKHMKLKSHTQTKYGHPLTEMFEILRILNSQFTSQRW